MTAVDALTAQRGWRHWAAPMGVGAAASVVRSLSRRVVVDTHPSLEGSDRSWVLALFHAQLLPLLSWPRRRALVALVSESDDGELLSEVLKELDVGVVRGSSSRGAVRGLKNAVKALQSGADVAFAVDGPKGPREVARAGALAAAQLADAWVVPAAASWSSGFRLRTWDRFEIPAPWATVSIALGPPLHVGASTCELTDAIRATRSRAERHLATEPST